MEREALKVARIASEVRWLRESMLRSADTEDKKRVAERCNELIDRRAAEIHFWATEAEGFPATELLSSRCGASPCRMALG